MNFPETFYLVIIDISRYFHYVVVAIQSNIALLVFLRQLCIAYLYATKVVRASLIVYRQFSYKKNTLQVAKYFRLYCASQQRINVLRIVKLYELS